MCKKTSFTLNKKLYQLICIYPLLWSFGRVFCCMFRRKIVYRFIGCRLLLMRLLLRSPVPHVLFRPLRMKAHSHMIVTFHTFFVITFLNYFVPSLVLSLPRPATGVLICVCVFQRVKAMCN
uniref:Uncharacterized protein n=1 Tax=Parascaris univalens TaxID=6257 RepID=A0A915BAN2_PARUN